MIWGRTDALWLQDDDEVARVMALDRQLDLVGVLTGAVKLA